MKWYDETERDNSVVVASRIRLVRNLGEYRFPVTMDPKEAAALTSELSQKLKRLSEVDGRSYNSLLLKNIDRPHREALKEKRIINSAPVDAPKEAGLLLSSDEAVSVTLNSIDHIRLQVSQSGMDLEQIWGQIDKLDDCINELYPYAFDENLGYMTAYPTNLGTGMKASLILHLPLLDSMTKFSDLLTEIGRYGVNLKPAFGKNRETSGSLYVLQNQKTLGISEKDMIQVMEKVAGQLAGQEKNLRKRSVEKHSLTAEDICCKAYGTLRYSKMMTLQTGMHLLSQLRWGQEEKVISFEKYCNIYELMIGIQPGSLAVSSGKALQGEALDCERARYLQRLLPELKQN